MTEDFDLSNAQWLWHAADGENPPSGITRYFHKRLSLPTFTQIERAAAYITADNEFTFSIDGKEIAKGDDWEKLHYIDFTPHAKKRTLQLQVVVKNGGTAPNPAGLIGKIVVSFKNGEELIIRSYKNWRTSETPDGEQVKSAELGPLGISPWGEITEIVDITPAPEVDAKGKAKIRPIRAAVTDNSPFLRALGRPDRAYVSTIRTSQATLLEALELTNGTFLDDAIKKGAAELLERYKKSPKASSAKSTASS